MLRLSILNVDNLRKRISEEAYGSRYSIHHGATKIYRDLRKLYWWNVLKMDIEEFISKCPNFKEVKVEHIKTSVLIQEMGVPTWKWEEINWTLLFGCLKPGGKMTQFG